ncbi:Hypothetical_protein [Hexamita inflata]|uniref:Hypothetical_protein n=1 Tax=Hexamita inflata TaxID=28002 RepID=A0AA86P567_9EUKA|nr:Hypothetical protein HINF_LOCUS19626 [Hexamita inflata]CAI9969360.1 Hypothetical protein HINF_LOCUS57005 [Hexamita inflata]
MLVIYVARQRALLQVFAQELVHALAHVPSLQFSTITPSSSDPALHWASPSCLAQQLFLSFGETAENRHVLTILQMAFESICYILEVLNKSELFTFFKLYIYDTCSKRLWTNRASSDRQFRQQLLSL